MPVAEGLIEDSEPLVGGGVIRWSKSESSNDCRNTIPPIRTKQK